MSFSLAICLIFSIRLERQQLAFCDDIGCTNVAHNDALSDEDRPCGYNEAMRFEETGLESRVADLMGARPLGFRPAKGGYTAALRGIVRLDDGRSVFLKAATDERTAKWLRAEHVVYSYLSKVAEGEFAPEMLGWDDNGGLPILALEDLSGAHWPPPWEAGMPERVVEALSRLRRIAPMPGMKKLASHRDEMHGWRIIAEDPMPFLSLGLCSAEWLDAALPTLVAAEEGVDLAGEDFLHWDVRSDNLCFAGGKMLLVDWNWACAGNGVFDLALWLPSLHAEGGPAPESILAHSPEMAAVLSGVLGKGTAMAPLGTPRSDMQLSQLRSALPWAARELGLPSL